MVAFDSAPSHFGLNRKDEVDRYFVGPLMFIAKYDPNLEFRQKAIDLIGDCVSADHVDRVLVWLSGIVRDESCDKKSRALAYLSLLRLRVDKRGFLQRPPYEDGFPEYVDWEVVR